jgi:hypothetical protein
MPTKTKALPAGWSKVLDEVQARLDQAVTSANARLEALPPGNPESLADERRHAVAQWNERLHRLSNFLDATEQVVQSVDELLLKEEARLRQQLAACETLRQKAG